MDINQDLEDISMKLSQEANLNSAPPSPDNNTILPPCRVCGEKASGFHYGANTCEACKGFFRRSLRRKTDYKCMQNDNCKVYRMQKNNKCPKCRLDRCLAIGMSKEGIRNGRYTLETRTKYIKEVKALQNAQEDVLDSKVESNKDYGSKALPDRTEPVYNERLEGLINYIVSTYMQNPICTPEFLAGMEEREKKFFEEQAIEKEMFGELKIISSEEYRDIHKSTGLDVDGREGLLNKFNGIADQFVIKLINFARGVPGFTEMHVDDQMCLLKNGTLDGWGMMLGYKYVYNFEKEIIHSICGTIYDRKRCAMFHEEICWDMGFALAKKITKLNFTEEEDILSAAVCMFQCDQFTLVDAKKVEECLDGLVECLFYLLRKNHPDQPHLFAKFVSYVAEFRSIEHVRLSTKKFEETFDLQLNQLWHELSQE